MTSPTPFFSTEWRLIGGVNPTHSMDEMARRMHLDAFRLCLRGPKRLHRLAHQEIGDAVPDENAGICQHWSCWVSISWAGSDVRKNSTLDNLGILEPCNLGPGKCGTLQHWNLAPWRCNLEPGSVELWTFPSLEPCNLATLKHRETLPCNLWNLAILLEPWNFEKLGMLESCNLRTSFHWLPFAVAVLCGAHSLLLQWLFFAVTVLCGGSDCWFQCWQNSVTRTYRLLYFLW